MKGLILLDGPDCSGKTTLCEEIIKAAGLLGHIAVRRHLGKPTKGKTWEVHSEAIMSYIEEMNRDHVIVIADRHFLSEGVYGRVYRDGGEYPYTMRFVDMLFNKACALKVICCPPTDVVVNTHKKMKAERDELFSEGMDRVANTYQAIWHSSFSPTSLPGADYTAQLTALGGVQDKSLWYHYDYTVHDVREYANHILDELYREQTSRNSYEYLNFNGTPNKRSILLVGDKMGTANKLSIPFFANHGSSLFLAKALHNLVIPAEELCIINVNDPGGILAAKTFSKLCKRVVVLGREAERTMRFSDIHFDAFCRHPQHARRFNYNDDTYTKELKAAIWGRQ